MNRAGDPVHAHRYTFAITDAQIQRIAKAAEVLRDEYRDDDSGDSPILPIQATTGKVGDGATGDHIGQVIIEVMFPKSAAAP